MEGIGENLPAQIDAELIIFTGIRPRNAADEVESIFNIVGPLRHEICTHGLGNFLKAVVVQDITRAIARAFQGLAKNIAKNWVSLFDGAIDVDLLRDGVVITPLLLNISRDMSKEIAVFQLSPI